MLLLFPTEKAMLGFLLAPLEVADDEDEDETFFPLEDDRW